METEFISTLTRQFTRESSRIIGIMVKGSMNFQMEPFIRVNGRMASCMELVCLSMQMVGLGMDNLESVFFRPKFKNNLED